MHTSPAPDARGMYTFSAATALLAHLQITKWPSRTAKGGIAQQRHHASVCSSITCRVRGLISDVHPRCQDGQRASEVCLRKKAVFGDMYNVVRFYVIMHMTAECSHFRSGLVSSTASTRCLTMVRLEEKCCMRAYPRLMSFRLMSGPRWHMQTMPAEGKPTVLRSV